MDKEPVDTSCSRRTRIKYTVDWAVKRIICLRHVLIVYCTIYKVKHILITNQNNATLTYYRTDTKSDTRLSHIMNIWVAIVPAGSPSRGGDVMVYITDKN